MAERFYCDLQTSGPGGEAWLDADETHHLVKVMRIRPGSTITVFGHGRQFEAQFHKVEAQKAVLTLEREVKTLPGPQLCLTSCIPWLKGGKTEFIIQKLVEVGVSRLILFSAEREVARLDPDKLPRLHKVAVEACKQSGRSQLPTITLAESLFDALAAAANSPEMSYVLYEQEVQCRLSQQLSRLNAKEHGARALTLCTGPEGGFSESEIESIHGMATTVSLGQAILRADTAPIVGAAIAMAWSGDM